MFRDCPKAMKCTKNECESTHNVLMHDAESNFSPRKEENESSTGKIRRINQRRLVPHPCRTLKGFGAQTLKGFAYFRFPGLPDVRDFRTSATRKG